MKIRVLLPRGKADFCKERAEGRFLRRQQMIVAADATSKKGACSHTEGPMSPGRCNFVLEQKKTNLLLRQRRYSMNRLCVVINKPFWGKIWLRETNCLFINHILSGFHCTFFVNAGGYVLLQNTIAAPGEYGPLCSLTQTPPEGRKEE